MSLEDLTRILFCATELVSNYDIWIKYDNVIEILNNNKDGLIKCLKTNNPQFSEKSINSIVMSFYINMYIFMNETKCDYLLC